ncbi:hypothetical protein V8G54_032565 [Vigna mungo]|uniref:Amidase domain-containing protein n=1 Tax=Vigna mungo TaxID=3915 RepID=A0AAQ3RI13_VIGMU
MSKSLKLNASNPKVWLLIGIGLAGAVVLVETRRRRCRKLPKEDFGAFVERFELLPIPQPDQTQTLSSLSFAIKDIFDVKGYVTGFGNPHWKRTHSEAGKTAIVITALLSNGATCVGKTVMDEFSFGISGENKFYGTPINPYLTSSIPGGSSSGSAVAVAARLVDFAIGTDTTGCVRIPAAFCGILGFRPSHGVVSTIGVLPNAQSLDTVAMNSTHDHVKTLYKVRNEMRVAFQRLLKDDGILVIPTVPDDPLKRNTDKGFSSEFHDRAFALSSIASISGCCQVAIPLGCHKDCCASVSFISAHGADKFLLNTVLDMYTTIQEQVSVAYALPQPDTNGGIETSELLKEKGNAAFKGRLWNKAVDYYSEAINLNGKNATYFSNRAAAYLELGWYKEAEEDCNKAILHDKKNVKAYLRRGTAREQLLRYKEALKGAMSYSWYPVIENFAVLRQPIVGLIV